MARIDGALRERGNAVAIRTEAATLSANDLRRRSNALAATLQPLSTTRNAVIAVAADLTSASVVSLLAVAKTGAAFLPLSAESPRALLAHQLRVAQVELLVADPSTGPWIELAEDTGVRLIAPSGEECEEFPLMPPLSDDVAYVIFTSGSTGRPKAVAVPHRSLWNYTISIVERLGGESAVRGARLGIVTTLAADLAYTMLFPGLTCGAELHLLSSATASDPEEFALYNERYRLHGLKIVPTHLRALLDATRGAAALPERFLIVGGETFTLDLLAEIAARKASCRVFNHYGPTETCIGVAMNEVNPTQDISAMKRAGLISVPIGTPVNQVRLTVVDDQLNPVPDGVRGELLVSGIAVALGYLGRPAETAAAFVADRVAPGERSYRTGDLAVRSPADGALVLLGRRDRQLKIRGYRVEAAGVEAVLRRHPDVRDVHVDARDVGDLGRVLVAWIVLADPTSLEAVREHATQQLPAAHVPSQFMVTPAFPLTANGKLDVGRLPVPKRPAAVAPSSLVDRIASHFATALGRDHVEPTTDFFLAGGHSLAAVRLLARLRAELRLTADLRTLFAHPTPAMLASVLRAVPARAQAREPASAEELDELTPQELALWLEQQRDPGTIRYNIPVVLTIRGTLDPEDISSALSRIVARHEILRTCYPDDSGEPRALIQPVVDVPLPVFELSLDSAADQQRAMEIIDGAARTQFDVTVGSLLRAVLVRWSPTHHVLVLAVHHLIFDGHSVTLFVNELAEGLGPSRSEGQRTLVSFARSSRVRGPAKSRDDAGDLPVLAPIPPAALGLPEREQSRGRARQHRRELSGSVTDDFIQFARAHRVTPFMALLAALGVVLARQDDERRFYVAVPADLRTEPEKEQCIGCYVGIVLVEIDLMDDPSVVALLSRVRDALLFALDERERSFAVRVQEARERFGPHDVTRVMLSFEALQSATTDGLIITRDLLELPVALADVDIVVVDREAEGWTILLNYDETVCTDARAAALADQLETAMRQMVGVPTSRASGVTLLSADAQRSIMAWSGTNVPVALDRIDELVFERAERTPHAIAIDGPGVRCTYGEIAERSREVATWLDEQGVARGDIVGVTLPHGPELIATWLGVLSHGAAILAMDPDWPRARTVVATDVVNARLIIDATTNCVPLTAVPDRVRRRVAASPADTAYVILTSGSTGTPRAVAVPHGALANHFAGMQSSFPIGDGDRILAHTSPGFDVAVWEILGPLAAGSSIVAAEPQRRRDVGYLAELIDGYGVTALQVVPSLLNAWLDEPAFLRCKTLRRVFCGGEEMPVALARRFRELCPTVRLLNMYGPTETTIDASCHEVGSPFGDAVREREPERRISIGRPVMNARLYVVDESLALVPIGVSGEILIGGAGVAHGYIGAPRDTATRFVPDVFSGDEGMRLFRTGDRGRWDGEGQLEFIGRSDDQIKLRGYRIEPAEIEMVLMRVPGVRDVVVQVVDAGTSNARLVALVRPAIGAQLFAGDLRSAVSSALPRAFIPTAFIRCDELPYHPNGKINRGALPTDGPRLAERPADILDDTEQAVATIWRQLIGTDIGSIDSSFFECGGNSLLLLRLRSRLAERFGVTLTVLDLFEQVTIQRQARLIRERGHIVEPASRVIAQMADRRAAYSRLAQRGRDRK